ncbi:MAG: ParB/RepB/Spo0J family partition protein [Ignavibacterium sp.]|nr:ParB/RepB/Spo0J family partition protein [Ignavibacterium sp.]MCX7612250.1 ParB/RepB/Spo0J family partition protein [Ignavibacterium sp.]MDW8374340.1 ParB/RepB/Spo0J family partition protein [Ignavibacteriales bacterium]
MSKVRSSLGRGLDALLSSSLNEEKELKINEDLSNLRLDDGKQENVLVKISVDLIQPNPFQPRMTFDPVALEELKKSILLNGLIQPITVRRTPNNQYQLVSGERRLRAFKELGFREIPSYIIKVESDEILLALALIENIQRERLNPIEVAQAYKRLMNECHLTQEEIAEKVGKDRTTVANTLRLLKLPEIVQKALIEEKITMGHARAILSLPNEKLQILAFQKVVDESLSVRKIEKLAKSVNKSGAAALGHQTTRNQNIHINEIEDRIQKVLGTKVICNQKSNGSGELIIHFYSNDELERLLEMIESLNDKIN